MDCSTAQGLFNAYHEGELSRELLVELERHLESCPECGVLEKEMRSIHDSVTELFSRNSLPADFERKVVDALPTSSQVKVVRWRMHLAWASAAAAAVLVITFLSLDIWRSEAPAIPAPSETAAREAQPQPAEVAEGAGSEKTQAGHPPRREEPESEHAGPVVPGDLAKSGSNQTGGEKPAEPRLAQKSETIESESPKSAGHGKPGGVESELLASPPEAHPGAAKRDNSSKKRPQGVNGSMAGSRQSDSPWSSQLTEEGGRREATGRMREHRGKTVKPAGMHPKLARRMSIRKHPGAVRRTREHPKTAGRRLARVHPHQARRMERRHAFLKKHPKFAKFAKRHPEKAREIIRRRLQKKYREAAESVRKHPGAARKLIQRRNPEGSPARAARPKRPTPVRRPAAPRRPKPPGRPNAPAGNGRPGK